jgi:hypothetical protein
MHANRMVPEQANDQRRRHIRVSQAGAGSGCRFLIFDYHVG